DRELALVRDTAALRHRTFDLISDRRRLGTAAEVDVARAETELAVTETEAAALAIRRAATQNALAVLIGEPAPAVELSIVQPQNPSLLPAVPPGLPSGLLERRPDIAAAERSLAAANARIGVAKAA